MAVRNLAEGEVEKEYERLKGSAVGFCGCAICRDDVMVFALNRVKAHYVTQHRGAVLQHLSLQSEQNVADVSVAVLNGLKVVTASPRTRHRELAAERDRG